MKLNKKIKLLPIYFMPTLSIAQGSQSVEMADAFRADGKIYVVVLGLVIILTAMIILLIRVDKRIFHLEREFKKDN